LPCLPLAGQLLKPTVKVEVHELPGTVTVDFRSVISNHRLRRRIVNLTSLDETNWWQKGTTSEDQDSTNAVNEYTVVEEELLAPFVSREKELAIAESTWRRNQS
jgi:hypothetical protein